MIMIGRDYCPQEIESLVRETDEWIQLDISCFSLTKKEVLDESSPKRSNLILGALLSVFGNHHDKNTLENGSLRGLGVNYLKAAELVMLIQKHLQVQVSFTEVFFSMSLKKFAEYLADIFDAFDEEISYSDPRRPIPMKKTQVRKHYPLSFGQKSLWFFQNSNPENAAYNLSLAVHMEGELRLSKLKQACFQLVSQHPTLNMRFKISTKGLEQTPLKVEETGLHFRLERIRNPIRMEIQKKIDDQANTPFDIEKENLIRFHVICFSKNKLILQIVTHQIALDMWSFTIIFEQLLRLLRSPKTLSLKKHKNETKTSFDYFDYIGWQKQQVVSSKGRENEAYWLDKLKGEIPRLNFCVYSFDQAKGISNPPQPPQTGFGKSHRFSLDVKVVHKIEKIIFKENLSLFAFLFSIWQIVLHKYSGDHRILTGFPYLGRSLHEMKDIVGRFANPLVIESRFTSKTNFIDFFHETQKQIIEAVSHGEYPFSLLVEKLRLDQAKTGDAAYKKLAEGEDSSAFLHSFFTFQPPQNNMTGNIHSIMMGFPGEPVSYYKWKIKPWAWNQCFPLFDINFAATQAPGGEIQAMIQYSGRLFEDSLIEQMSTHFEFLIKMSFVSLRKKLTNVCLLTRAENRRLIRWNLTQVNIPQNIGVYGLFEETALRYPSCKALLFKSGSMSYKILAERIFGLAAFLSKKDVQVGDVVAVCLDRRPELIISLLALWKLGAIYLPVDPGLPKKRIKFMLSDSKAKYIITHSKVFPNLGEEIFSKMIYLDEKADELADEMYELKQAWPKSVGREVKSNISHKTPAYIVYTPGVTSKPRGVVLRHEGLLNLVQAQRQEYQIEPEHKVLLNAPIDLDISIYEMALGLMHGASIALMDRSKSLSEKDILIALKTYQISHLVATPHLLSKLPKEKLSFLKHITVAGETCSRELADHWAEGREFFNIYGSAETTIWACVAKYRNEVPLLHIGKPIANTQVWILDENHHPTPYGVVGEIHIAGSGLAEGYINQKLLTQQNFIEKQILLDIPKTRFYKTGDFGFYLRDGSIKLIKRLGQKIADRQERQVSPDLVEARKYVLVDS